VTRAGRFLRRTRIDEIPQLWNVLRGEMSLVGPRPERPEFEAWLGSLHPSFRWRSAVRPGLTGWAQTRLGYVDDCAGWESKLAHDLYYIKHRSFWIDLRILFATIRTLVRCENTEGVALEATPLADAPPGRGAAPGRLAGRRWPDPPGAAEARSVKTEAGAVSVEEVASPTAALPRHGIEAA
jgi:hypothetical protein